MISSPKAPTNTLLFMGALFFTINLGFLLLSEEQLVFSSSFIFLFLCLLSLRSSVRSYFFSRTYHLFVIFLHGLRGSKAMVAHLSSLLFLLLLESVLLLRREQLLQEAKFLASSSMAVSCREILLRSIARSFSLLLPIKAKLP